MPRIDLAGLGIVSFIAAGQGGELDENLFSEGFCGVEGPGIADF